MTMSFTDGSLSSSVVTELLSSQLGLRPDEDVGEREHGLGPRLADLGGHHGLAQRLADGLRFELDSSQYFRLEFESIFFDSYCVRRKGQKNCKTAKYLKDRLS